LLLTFPHRLRHGTAGFWSRQSRRRCAPRAHRIDQLALPARLQIFGEWRPATFLVQAEIGHHLAQLGVLILDLLYPRISVGSSPSYFFRLK
jgi:hypothetical protein